MYRLSDVSSIFENFDLRKTGNIILMKSFDFLEGMLGNVGKTSPSNTANVILRSSLQQFIPREMTPEMSNYLARVALRTLVGLPLIEITAKDKDAISKLKGSISWISEKKIDVTEIIREMRDS